MIIKPPDWQKYISSEFFQKALNSTELVKLVKRAERDYIYWDKFRFLPMPNGFKPEEAWAFLKFRRLSNQETTAVKSVGQENFSFTITKKMFERLSVIDSNTSGLISSDLGKPTSSERNQLIISSLTEEAIASSQIEGANTSRKVAKQMLLSKRKARNTDEQMIINNYQVMQRLQDWKDLDLSIEMLIEIQKNIASGTLDDEGDAGRLRRDDDHIHVVNRLTGESVFEPPNAEVMHKELAKLVSYANDKMNSEDFIHPVIKASILHFWLAYLHPFVDGNGRTARALFYWYLLKKNYWMFQYLSVSRIIKQSKRQYDNAFLYAEYDENDITYFLSYKLKVITQSIEDFWAHYRRKVEKEKRVEKIALKLGEFNERQVSILQFFHEHKDATMDVMTHQSKFDIAYETARADLMGLAEKDLVSVVKAGNRFIFIPDTAQIKRLISKI